MLGLGDDQIAATPNDTNSFLFDEFFVTNGVIWIDCDETSLGLGDNLLSYNEHIAIEQWAIWFGATSVDNDVSKLIARNDFTDS
jgi:hypothetical protein